MSIWSKMVSLVPKLPFFFDRLACYAVISLGGLFALQPGLIVFLGVKLVCRATRRRYSIQVHPWMPFGRVGIKLAFRLP